MQQTREHDLEAAAVGRPLFALDLQTLSGAHEERGAGDFMADDSVTFKGGAGSSYILGESVNEFIGLTQNKKHLRFFFDVRHPGNINDIRRFAIDVPVERAMSFLAILQETARVEGYPMPEVAIRSVRQSPNEKS
jgi:hypothetical protein